MCSVHSYKRDPTRGSRIAIGDGNVDNGVLEQAEAEEGVVDEGVAQSHRMVQGKNLNQS